MDESIPATANFIFCIILKLLDPQYLDFLTYCIFEYAKPTLLKEVLKNGKELFSFKIFSFTSFENKENSEASKKIS